MSKPLFEDYFSISTRRNRRSYIFNLIILFIMSIIAAVVILPIGWLVSANMIYASFALFLLYCLVIDVILIMLAIQRSNDIGLPRAPIATLFIATSLLSTFTLIVDGTVMQYGLLELMFGGVVADVIITTLHIICVLLWLYLAFRRGQPGANQWGPDPLAEHPENANKTDADVA